MVFIHNKTRFLSLQIESGFLYNTVYRVIFSKSATSSAVYDLVSFNIIHSIHALHYSRNFLSSLLQFTLYLSNSSFSIRQTEPDLRRSWKLAIHPSFNHLINMSYLTPKISAASLAVSNL
jgi:hypothetical protein